jgi:hypothetical protein
MKKCASCNTSYVFEIESAVSTSRKEQTTPRNFALHKPTIAPGGRGCANNPVKGFLLVISVVLKKRVLPEAL